ncbi:MAG TPA: hypothetical protein VHA10_22100 [Hypericibacter adhaerens]|uniref:hypothetical protein n=1 Tax=Hypericibacter adhaerens TaxID=2602016 RepID=UPI002C29134E|nr:hypothetical protein [Hypericibacter adhaerens]HWA45928.1 hypothetical protein [Hypericibacter adhaerens]
MAGLRLTCKPLLLALGISGLLALPAAAEEIAATSKASAQGDARMLDNTSFDFSSCRQALDADRMLLRLHVTQQWDVNSPEAEGHVRLDAFEAKTGTTGTPLYTVEAEGAAGHILADCLFQIDRGLEDLEWWQINDLATGTLLFETMAEPLIFATIDDEQIRSSNAAGFYVPPDDEADKRLADPHVVGLVTLASDGKVVSRFLVTASDPEKAAVLRSYWDERRYLAVIETGKAGALGSATAEEPLSKRPLSLEVSWPVAGLALRLPIGPGGLRIEGASVPQGLEIAPW